MNIDDVGAARVSEFWGDEKKDLRKHNWVEHPVARACINERISGDPNVGTCEHWRRNFLRVPAKLALSVGCGFGNFERAALEMGLAERLDAVDISESAIKQARAYAAEQGMADRIDYAVSDLNNAVFPEARYDAIFGIASVHHVKGLEALFHQCRLALKPGGLLFLDEYIGPTRFQSKPNVVTLINRLLRSLPERYRLNVYANGTPKDVFVNPPLSWFEEFDPSEAVRSDEILTTLATHFEVVEVRPWGGAILHMLLSGTAGNFDPGWDSDVALIKTMALLEETLEEAGVIAPDFAAIVARPYPLERDIRPFNRTGRKTMSGGIEILRILEEQKSHIERVAQRYGVLSEIHPKDMLFDFLVRTVFQSNPSQAVDAYFAGGEDCCRKFASVYTEAGKKGGAVLEFASGYGRVARYSRKVLPDVKWVCCDVHPEAVEFNQWTVGVRTIMSSSKPEHLDVGSGTFDAVFALSFFSHMPDKTFGVWLVKLYEAVAVDGILVFTTHGEVSARNMCAGGLEAIFDDSGFFWNSASDQRDLDVEEYGTSVVTFDYVRRAIERLANYSLIQFQQAFWWEHQDLYVIRKLPTSSNHSRSGDKLPTAIEVNFPPENMG